jgi:thioesterase domain-containing protein
MRMPSCLVPLHRNAGQPNLFLVHPASGEVLCYLDLASRLAAAQVFGVQARGLDFEHESAPSVEQMAARYADAMRATQPRGPYHLAGWSFGGLVALEVARRLRDQGESVPLLAMLDTRLRPDPERIPPFNLRDFLLSWLPERETDAADIQGLGDDALIDWFLQEADRLGILRTRLRAPEAKAWFRVFEATHEAARRYRPGPYEGPILLFRCSGRTTGPPALGWDAIAPNLLEVQDVPGRHNAVIQPPAVSVIATIIDARLAAGRKVQ